MQKPSNTRRGMYILVIRTTYTYYSGLRVSSGYFDDEPNSEEAELMIHQITMKDGD